MTRFPFGDFKTRKIKNYIYADLRQYNYEISN